MASGTFLILTRRGACELSVRYGVQIADGMVINGGGIATVQGRVTRSGTVSVIVQSGNQWAKAIAASAGIAAAARGQGTSGARYGTWVAERRE
jgi:hypothetical protein